MGNKLPLRLDNFRFLDPDAPRTRRIIECATSILTPWEPQEPGPRFEPPALVELAKRIGARAQQGLTVHLKPTTARTVATTMRLYAEGHPDLRQSHPHHVEDWTNEPHEILAYCTTAVLAIGAWEHHAPQYPDRKLIATWGGWITRGSKRDNA